MKIHILNLSKSGGFNPLPKFRGCYDPQLCRTCQVPISPPLMSMCLLFCRPSVYLVCVRSTPSLTTYSPSCHANSSTYCSGISCCLLEELSLLWELCCLLWEVRGPPWFCIMYKSRFSCSLGLLARLSTLS